uniref:Uncharacterized protein n=1 Tax=Oryza brachyantha TaxID=4533 RepID=J3MIL8_ORYBR
MPHTFASPAPHLAGVTPIAVAPAQHFTLTPAAAEPHAEMTHFSFDHFMPVHVAAPASGPAGDYNLNFSMSSGLVGVHSRGTLQSNSQSHLSSHHHHQQQQQLQRLSAPLDAPNIPFLFSPAAAPTAADSQFAAAAAALQLWRHCSSGTGSGTPTSRRRASTDQIRSRGIRPASSPTSRVPPQVNAFNTLPEEYN